MTTITEHEMKRRALVAKLQGTLTDVIGQFVSDDDEGITYLEALTALNNVGLRLLGQLQVDEWREQP